MHHVHGSAIVVIRFPHMRVLPLNVFAQLTNFISNFPFRSLFTWKTLHGTIDMW